MLEKSGRGLPKHVFLGPNSLSVHPPIYPSINPSIPLSTCPLIYLPIHPSRRQPYFHLSVSPFIHPSFLPSFHFSFLSFLPSFLPSIYISIHCLIYLFIHLTYTPLIVKFNTLAVAYRAPHSCPLSPPLLALPLTLFQSPCHCCSSNVLQALCTCCLLCQKQSFPDTPMSDFPPSLARCLNFSLPKGLL